MLEAMPVSCGVDIKTIKITQFWPFSFLINCVFFQCQSTEIDQNEARLNALRTAIAETFPEPNRRLLQR